MFLHEHADFEKLCRIIATDKGIPVQLVEKDYWLMHVLWGLQQQKFRFDLKGGTSLSKGFLLINRFSEDIDILIFPKESEDVPRSKNAAKAKHVLARREFFDSLAARIKIPGIEAIVRDTHFDNNSLMSAGIRLH